MVPRTRLLYVLVPVLHLILPCAAVVSAEPGPPPGQSAAQAPAASQGKPVRHRIMVSEYGRGPNRLLELDADGMPVWEHRFPSIAFIFSVLPNGNVIYAYGGNPTGVQEISRAHQVVWNYE